MFSQYWEQTKTISRLQSLVNTAIIAAACVLPILGENAFASTFDPVRTVALSGQPAPGTTETFADVGYFGVSLNNRGETAFVASTSYSSYEFLSWPNRASDPNDEGIWSEAGGAGLRLIARERTSLVSGRFVTHVARPFIGDDGSTVFVGWEVPGTKVIWRHTPLTGNLIVAAGRPSVSGPQVYTDFSFPAVDRHGRVAFSGDLQTTSSGILSGIWIERADGSFELAARLDSPAPGASAIIRELPFSPPSWAGGYVTFGALLGQTTANVFPSGGAILRAGPNEPLSVVHWAADPTISGDIGISTPGPSRINSRGEMAFLAGIEGESVWTRSPTGGFQRVATEGDSAPGTNGVFGSNSFYSRVFYGVEIGDGGHVALTGNVLQESTTRSGIWIVDPMGNLTAVAIEGESAPGVSGQFSSVGAVTVNAAGQVAFSARVFDFAANHLGIWAQDRSGTLRKIAVAGDQLDVSDDSSSPDFRTIEYLSFREGGDLGERVTGFNDVGQVAFFARFTDGTSGVFVSDVVAVPEPATAGATLVVLAALASIGRRHRRSP